MKGKSQMNGITIKYLQEYLASKELDFDSKDAFLKLIEEVGELADAMLRNPERATNEVNFKGSIEEELCDVIAICLYIANSYGIDMEKWIPVKEQMHNERWGNSVVFETR